MLALDPRSVTLLLLTPLLSLYALHEGTPGEPATGQLQGTGLCLASALCRSQEATGADGFILAHQFSSNSAAGRGSAPPRPAVRVCLVASHRSIRVLSVGILDKSPGL